MNRIASFSLSLILGLLALPAFAQQTSSPDQGSSLADYARQVRKEVPKGKPKVFDNDNLPTEDKLSVIGGAPETASNAADAKPTETAGAAPATAGATAKTEAGTAPAAGDTKAAERTAKSPDDEQKEKQAAWKQWQEKLAAQKESIDLLTRELDVLQREYQIAPPPCTPTPATESATPPIGISRTRNTSNKSPTNRNPSTTLSRRWTTSKKKPARPASRPPCATNDAIDETAETVERRTSGPALLLFVQN